MSCTSKCLMLSARLPVSRTTAKASGSRSSRDSPFSDRCLNSAVLALSCSSVRLESRGSKSLIFATNGWIFFISRSFLEPTNFLTNVSSIYECNGRGDIATRGTKTDKTTLLRSLVRLCGPEALTAGQVISWIYRAIVDPNFVMQVRGGTAARSPNVTNHVILPDPLPGFHGKLGEVAKPCRETITVIDDNQIPVRGLPLCVDDFAIGGGTDLGSKQGTDIRSEEHTSELQSLTNLVCRLLLEKKKKKKKTKNL